LFRKAPFKWALRHDFRLRRETGAERGPRQWGAGGAQRL